LLKDINYLLRISFEFFDESCWNSIHDTSIIMWKFHSFVFIVKPKQYKNIARNSTNRKMFWTEVTAVPKVQIFWVIHCLHETSSFRYSHAFIIKIIKYVPSKALSTSIEVNKEQQTWLMFYRYIGYLDSRQTHLHNATYNDVFSSSSWWEIWVFFLRWWRWQVRGCLLDCGDKLFRGHAASIFRVKTETPRTSETLLSYHNNIGRQNPDLDLITSCLRMWDQPRRSITEDKNCPYILCSCRNCAPKC
jgi:hypothetical protein